MMRIAACLLHTTPVIISMPRSGVCSVPIQGSTTHAVVRMQEIQSDQRDSPPDTIDLAVEDANIRPDVQIELPKADSR